MTTALEKLGYDLGGWKEIAAYVSLSQRVAHERADREKNPLPVTRFGGGIVAKSTEIDAWAKREIVQSRRNQQNKAAKVSK